METQSVMAIIMNRPMCWIVSDIRIFRRSDISVILGFKAAITASNPSVVVHSNAILKFVSWLWKNLGVDLWMSVQESRDRVVPQSNSTVKNLADQNNHFSNLSMARCIFF